MKSEEEINALRECHVEEFGSYARSYVGSVLVGDDAQAARFLLVLSRLQGMIDAYRVVLE